MIFDPPLPRGGEIAILGLGRSGLEATKLLRRAGAEVYISDAATGEAVREAAERAKATGASAEAGHHDIERIKRSAMLVVSPGIPPSASPIRAAIERGIPVVSEVEIALRSMKRTRFIAVTGTNGKSTTTALIAHLLKGAGVNAAEAGNIGTPLSTYASSNAPPDWIALEMSSFQLHDTPSIAPEVGVLTNLSPDHLDRYASVDEYYADKALLFRNASSRSRWVINADDSAVVKMCTGISGGIHKFSLRGKADAFLDRQTGDLTVLGERIVNVTDLPMLGDHNIANVLAALLAVIIADKEFQSGKARTLLAASLKSFHGLPHRLEPVAEKNGILWINDSKATNVSSTAVAIASMTRPFILLLGGRHKGESYKALIAPMKDRCRKVIAFGESAELIEKDLKSAVDVERASNDFESVINSARKSAKPGDAVLLSPACSSYDMFTSYEHRGQRFRELVGAMD